jgi:L-malate glycosyltransferase
VRHKIILLNQAYPNPEMNNVGNPFVHDRAKLLAKYFDLVIAKTSSTETDYEYENVKVKCFKNLNDFQIFTNEYDPKLFIIHFCEPWMYTHGILKFDKPALIFVHGSEAHSWYRILFILNKNNIKGFLKFMFFNTLTVLNFRKMILFSNEKKSIHFAFVSDWMRRITETDTFTKINNYSIIHNGIDTNLFAFQKKTLDHRKKILILRSFDSKKYANDLSMDAILRLSRKSFFKDLEFHIYGKGIWWEKETNKIKHFSNVFLNNNFLNHQQIQRLHKDFGIFLCPTRMDAQGVSMCEAMSSGLVPVTSLSTAIPEFVKDGQSGFLTNNSKEIAEKIELLYNNPELFLKMSEYASQGIAEESKIEKVVNEEITLVERCIENNVA